MLRLCLRTLPYLSTHHFRTLSSSSSGVVDSAKLPPPILHRRYHLRDTVSSLPRTSLSRTSVVAISATFISALVASLTLLSSDNPRQNRQSDHKASNPLYNAVERAIRKSGESLDKVFRHIKQTGVAASVLWHSLSSVLSSANHEVRSGFELRVAELLADIAAASTSRRAAIVGAGGGAVVDWLLESVAMSRDSCGTQAESARALAYLIADPNVSASVLGRPHAIPNLLRFIFSCHPQRSKKHPRRSSLDIADSLKGRSMLVAAIMEMVTSSCDSSERASFNPPLPGNAESRDIAAALQVVEEGGIHLDETHGTDSDEDGGRGMKGIGIKILEGTTILGVARTSNLMSLGSSDDYHGDLSRNHAPRTFNVDNKHDILATQKNLSNAVVPGLWDDLHSEHVAVPFAIWALANWAMASELNRCRIQEMDQDGLAIVTALRAPERSVKWHGSLVARLLLEDSNLPLNDSVSDWSSSLLSTLSQACKNDDIALAQVALSAFLVSVERSYSARKIVMERGLNLMRDSTKQTVKHRPVQEALAKALELLSAGDLHLSLEESQKWSSVLLNWIFGKSSSDTMRSSAMRILSRILEDHGPSSVSISQGWLAILLTEVLNTTKKSPLKGSGQPKSDKVKTQVDHSNVVSATQVRNQLATAVVNLAVNQSGLSSDTANTFAMVDFLSLEPFVGPFKNIKKDSLPRIAAADSALSTLKGIKALTEVCSEDLMCQEKIVELGVLHLLRRFLLNDDYENLAANEAYDASRSHEGQEHILNAAKEPSGSDTNDSSSVRVPPTAHIRRHAARLLTILSLLPRVQKSIIADETWCKWLDDCANGKIPGCSSDLKIQSYARATLLNIFCSHQSNSDSTEGNGSDSGVAASKNMCPRYDDMIFLINPQLSHWKCPEKKDRPGTDQRSRYLFGPDLVDDENELVVQHVSSPSSEDILLDVIFVHGLRGGPYKTWRISEDKSSTKSGLVEKIDEEAGKLGTFWPAEWLSHDFRVARLFTLKYKTNLTQWSGASLPLQEVSSMLLEKLVAAGIGDRPIVFVTHSMGGLVVKQILYKAMAENIDNLVNNTVGIVFYSCPHFGSKLADMPWRMGLVFRPAPTIGELRSGSERLIELNDFIRHRHKKGMLDVLSFCETKVTPIVEGYGGWAFRMEIVPIESAYPGFGELVVLESTDHINSCKPLSRTDPSYTETLEFLRKLKSHYL